MDIISTTLKWLEIAGIEKNGQNQLALDLIKEEVQEIKEELEKDKIDIPRLMSEIVDLMWVASNMIYFNDSLEEFRKQAEKKRIENFSKFCKTREEAKKSIDMYANGNHPQKIGKRITDLTIFEVSGMFVIKRADGKVMKSYKTIT